MNHFGGTQPDRPAAIRTVQLRSQALQLFTRWALAQPSIGLQRRAAEQEGARGEEGRHGAAVAICQRGPVQRSSRGEHAPVSHLVTMVARAAAATAPFP
jgi:hypothetical protein